MVMVAMTYSLWNDIQCCDMFTKCCESRAMVRSQITRVADHCCEISARHEATRAQGSEKTYWQYWQLLLSQQFRPCPETPAQ